VQKQKRVSGQVIFNASKTSVALAETTRPKAAAAMHQQPSTLDADSSHADLGAVPAEECATAETTKEQAPEDFSPAALGSLAPELLEIFLMNSTWAADRTIMLRMTSKRVKELVDHLRPGEGASWTTSSMAQPLQSCSSFSDSLRR
jgi:hypothetical protein